MDSVDKAFEDLLALNLRLKRIHHFSSGVSGKEMRKDGDRCTSCGHWSLITSGVVEKPTVSLKTLIQACRVGRVDAVRSIVSDYEVDVDSTDSYGWSALHFAVLHNQKEVVNCLQTLGARELSTNEGILPSDMRPELFGKEPEPWQVPDTIEKLVDELETFQRLSRLSLPENSSILVGRLLRMFDKFGKEILNVVFLTECEDDSCIMLNIPKRILALLGAEFGWLWFCRVCLEFDVNVNSHDSSGRTTLTEACLFGHVECTRLLLEAGADMYARVFFDDSTPLHKTCVFGNIECIRLLLEAGINVNVRNSCDETALHKACRYGYTECARLLLESGAHVNAKNMYDQTPLHKACFSGHVGCTRLLLESGVIVNTINVYNETALHKTCWIGNSECVQLLLDADAEMDTRNEHAETALHVACKRGRTECARLLLEAGADVNIREENDRTALDVARLEGNTECARLLEEHLRL